MTGILGAAAATDGGLLNNTLVIMLVVLAITYVMIKLCSWAKNFALAAGIRITVFVLTGVGVVLFNFLYYRGNAMIAAEGIWQGATVAMVAALIWVVIFSFVLCTKTKAKD